jgi:hypothetical protein
MKRAATFAAIWALGTEKLQSLPQKEREPLVIARVRADSGLTVRDRLVRDCFSKARDPSAKK